MNGPLIHAGAARASWLWFLPVVAVYAVAALQQIRLPGVYMDAVNPDYLAVQVLNPDHADVITWVLRGNHLLGRRAFVLIAPYHGSQQYWLGLPFFWLFGTTVTGLRLTHALFAVGVLAALFALLRRCRLAPWQAAAACAALAVDPTFTYAFRTQSYITLAPCAWLLLALALLDPSSSAGPTRRGWLWSGVFAGLAIVGYFIYAFFLPVLTALAVRQWRATPAATRSAEHPGRRWLAGLALGASPYLLGLFLVARQSGDLAGLIAFVDEMSTALQPMSSRLTLEERVAFAWRMAHGSVDNAWHHALMFGEWVGVPGSAFKTAMLVAMPYALWGLAEYRHRASASLRVLIALPVSFFLVSLVFGGRLGGHHFVTLVPIFYGALALALIDNVPAGARCAWALFGLLAALNVAGQVATARMLAATRGVGLYSDAINRFAEDLNRMDAKPSLFTPDWGLAMPVVFLTRGDVPVDAVANFPKALRALCGGRDVAVAFIAGDRKARRDEWQRELGWDAPAVAAYRQTDGKVVFEVATFRANPRASRCASRVTPDPPR